MKRVEYFFARLPDERKPGKTYRSRWLMTREDIAARGGTAIEETRVVREVPDSPEEGQKAVYNSLGKPQCKSPPN